jgi:hypothetical protein
MTGLYIREMINRGDYPGHYMLPCRSNLELAQGASLLFRSRFWCFGSDFWEVTLSDSNHAKFISLIRLRPIL